MNKNYMLALRDLDRKTTMMFMFTTRKGALAFALEAVAAHPNLSYAIACSASGRKKK